MGTREQVRAANERAERAAAAAKLANARFGALMLRLHLEEGRRSLGDGRVQVVLRRRWPRWAARVRDWWRGRKEQPAAQGSAPAKEVA